MQLKPILSFCKEEVIDCCFSFFPIVVGSPLSHDSQNTANICAPENRTNFIVTPASGMMPVKTFREYLLSSMVQSKIKEKACCNDVEIAVHTISRNILEVIIQVHVSDIANEFGN